MEVQGNTETDIAAPVAGPEPDVAGRAAVLWIIVPRTYGL